MKVLKKYAWILFGGFILAFLLIVVNQLIALYANLVAVNPTLAVFVVSLLGIILLTFALSPVYLIVRLPRTLDLPENENDLPEYQKNLTSRLGRNRLVRAAGLDISRQEDFDKALVLLDTRAREVIRDTAGGVFLTTAISQNGKLDALTVLVTQTRMVWKIAHIYWQRPSVGDMITLYANVGATSLLASEIEDMDISRQVEPVINALLNSPGRSIPIVGHAAHIITDSLLEGSTNAFLTLRVGIVAQRYCGRVEVYDRRKIRSNSYVEASVMLKSLVVSYSGKVISSILKVMKDAGKRSVLSGLGAINRATGRLRSGVTSVTDQITGKKG